MFFSNVNAGLNKLTFDRCYDGNYKNADDFKKNNNYIELSWEINLEKKTATKIVKQFQEITNSPREYPIVGEEGVYGILWSDLTYTFYVKKGEVHIWEGWGDKTTIMKCEIID